MAYNEPAGSTLVFESTFNSLAGFEDTYNSVQIRADSSAPLSPSNCAYVRLPARATVGGCELHYFPGVSYPDMYMRIAFRLNSGYQGVQAQDKLFFIRGNDSNGLWGFVGGPTRGGGPFQIVFLHNSSLDNSHIWSADLGLIGYPNKSPGYFYGGQWVLLEGYIKRSTTTTSRNGTVRWWVNGTLCGDYTTANYGPSGFNDWAWTQTWDGNGKVGTVNTVDWEQFVDHLYLSTGGTVTPSPSVPTISSFTPTSGPVGTPITIVGTNFDPSPAGNAITLNGTSCTTLGAQPTQLNTAVPNNGTTGQIRVTTSAGTALSSTNFTVTTPSPGGGTGGGTGGGAGSTTGVFTTDFGSTQGPRWYYLNEDGSEMTYSSGLWSGNQLYKGIWNGGFHPGTSSAAVLKYVPPGSGSVRITGSFTDLDTGGGSGVICEIRKNGVAVSGGGPFTISNGDTTGFSYDISDSVTTTDYFTFEVLPNGNNSYDSTRLNPTVVYTPQSQTEETITLTLTSLAITQDTTGVITLTISPTRATESIVTLSSSSVSAVVPETVTIAANTSSVAVQVLAGTPGVATVTATLGTSTTSSTVTSVEAPPEPDPEDPVPASPTLSAYTDFLVAYRWF